MSAGALRFARVRGLSFSDEAIHRFAVTSAVMLVVIVATGATVRLTGSGLGCEHWPGCQPQHFEPRSFHSDIEFGNRVVAFFTILATLVAWIVARGHRLLAFFTFFGTLLQAPLGAITIHYHLNPWLVLAHFLLSAVVLTLGVVLACVTRPRDRTRLPAWVPWLGLVVGVAAAVLLFSGTLATASGPHPGSTVVRRLWSFQPAVYWHVRATAVFGLSFLVVLVQLVRLRAPQLRAGLVLLGLLLVQMAIGETQYRTQLPWWLVLVHVTMAATVWAAVTVFVYSLWRPRRMA
jgi:cytochrome c oxidase assembly protein subunit 15